jgi:E3 ubiquitin-protein ligase UBR1
LRYQIVRLLNAPTLSDLPHHDTPQNELTGWISHWRGQAAPQLNGSVVLDFSAQLCTAAARS